MDDTRDLYLLIDRVEQATVSERNRRRGKKAPAIGVGTEDPIIWTILFGFDANRYFSDPLFYAEQTLRQKLWRFENIDDDTPLTLDLPAWLGHYPEYTFLGLDVRFTEKGIPLLQEDHPLTREPDLRLLQPVDFATSGWMPRARRWYDDITRLVAGRLQVVNIPADKTLGISLHPNDVLVSSPAEMQAKLQFIADACRGRHIGVGTSGLTPIYDDPSEFPRRIATWLAIARDVFGQ